MSASISEFLVDHLGLDPTVWPQWLQTVWPEGAKWTVVLLSALIVWYAAKFIGRFAKSLMRRADKRDDGEIKDGSGELGGSIARLFSMILLSPIPLGLAGYDVKTLLETRGPGAVAAVAILVIAVMVANGVAKSMRTFGGQAHQRTGADDTLFAFAASFLKYIIFAVAIVLALIQLGFPAASLAALLGASALAIGLALQDTLKAVAAGIMLAMFRPFRIGDFVTLSGIDGEVRDITPFITTICQIDNKIVSITNDKVWGDALINHTRLPRRRLDLYFDISYDDDMDQALGIVKQACEEHPNVLDKQDIWVAIHSLGDFSVKVRARPWVATPNFIGVRGDLTKDIKERFDRAGITIPYPHQVEIQYQAGSRKSVEEAATPSD